MKDRKLFLVYVILIFTSLLIIQTNLVYAENLTASKYEINLTLDYQQQILSDPIEIKRTLLEPETRINKKNIYLESFNLKNSKGVEIPFQYIIIENPNLQKQKRLDSRTRFLVMKEDQQKSWFKIGLTKEAALLDPGEYTGIINIDDLDWQIKVTVLIKRFANFSKNDNTFEFEITEPFESNFFITADLYKIDIISNYSDWEVQGYLEGFTNAEGETLNSDHLFYRLEEVNRSIDINRLQKDQFSNFKEKQMIIINGRDYNQNLRAIRFGVDLGRESSTVQPAGLYNGKIVFTLRTLDNNL